MLRHLPPAWTMKTILSNTQVIVLVGDLIQRVRDCGAFSLLRHRAYAIPRGGIPVLYQLAGRVPGLRIVDDPSQADFFVDDIVDSGRTRDKWCARFPGKPFFGLIDKALPEHAHLGWVVFPWEISEHGDTGIEDNVIRILEYIGEDPSREGLHETPARVQRAWEDWCAGYRMDPSDVIKAFADGGEVYDEMVLMQGIPFYSQCEHHLAPFFGTADIAYIPDGKVIGLSKMPRVMDVFAKRLQVQERLTGQIANALMEHLRPKGVAVSLRARHLCMESRGVHKQGQETVTNTMLGVFRSDPSARAEFLSSIR